MYETFILFTKRLLKTSPSHGHWSLPMSNIQSQMLTPPSKSNKLPGGPTVHRCWQGAETKQWCQRVFSVIYRARPLHRGRGWKIGTWKQLTCGSDYIRFPQKNPCPCECSQLYLIVVAILPGRHLLSQGLQTVPHLQTNTHSASNTGAQRLNKKTTQTHSDVSHHTLTS